MSQFNTITEFNTYLSDKLRNVKLNEYFSLIQSQFYSNLNISFMDYFLELCNNENEFIVDHIKLQEYGVLNNIETSGLIKRRLESLDMIENEDYRVYNVVQPVKQGGFSTKKEYKLTSKAFKLCLMRSKNSKEYAKYYLLLEQVFKNYQEYQIMYQKVLMSGKDNTINEQLKTINEMKAKMDEILGYAKETKEQNEELLDKVDEMNDKVDEMNDNINDIKDAFKDTSDRSVPSAKNENERHEFILLQHKELENNFKFIRGIQKLNDSKINSKYSDFNIIKREYNANPIQLYKMFKETVKDNYKIEKQKITENKQLKNKIKLKKEVEKIKFNGNELILQYNYTINNLLDELTKVCNEKFNDYNQFTEIP